MMDTRDHHADNLAESSMIEVLPLELFEAVFRYLSTRQLLKSRSLSKSIRDFIDAGFHFKVWPLSYSWVDQTADCNPQCIPEHYRLSLMLSQKTLVHWHRLMRLPIVRLSFLASSGTCFTQKHRSVCPCEIEGASPNHRWHFHPECNLGVQHITGILGHHAYLTDLRILFVKIGNSGAQSLACSKSITSMDLYHCGIGHRGVLALAKNSNITTLGIASNPWCHGDHDGSLEVCEVLARNQTITRLNLGYAGSLGDKGVKILAENTMVRHLSLWVNEIGDEGAIALAKNSSIVELDLGNNSVGNKGLEALVLRNSVIRSLGIRNNQGITDDGVALFAQNSTIKILKLNHIGHQGLKTLAQNRSITELSLEFPKIAPDLHDGLWHLFGNPTIRALSIATIRSPPEEIEIIVGCKTPFRELKLCVQTFDAVDISGLISAFSSSRPALSRVEIQPGPVLSPSWDSVCAKLANIDCLTSLSVQKRLIGQEGILALSKSRSITSLRLVSCNIGDAGATALSGMAALTRATLDKNQIGDEGALALARSSTITSLCLSGNMITDVGAKALEESTKIIELTIGCQKKND